MIAFKARLIQICECYNIRKKNLKIYKDLFAVENYLKKWLFPQRMRSP